MWGHDAPLVQHYARWRGALAFERLLGWSLPSSVSRPDLDLLRLGFGFLGQADLQHALIVIGLDVFVVDGCRKREGASETAILALDPAIVLFFLFLLELAFAMNGQRVVLDADVDVFLVDAGDFDFERDLCSSS